MTLKKLYPRNNPTKPPKIKETRNRHLSQMSNGSLKAQVVLKYN